MPTVDVYSLEGKKVKEIELNEAILESNQMKLSYTVYLLII